MTRVFFLDCVFAFMVLATKHNKITKKSANTKINLERTGAPKARCYFGGRMEPRLMVRGRRTRASIVISAIFFDSSTGI